MVTSVAIVGSSGYSGVELARLVDRCPHLELTAVYSDRQKGEPIGASIPGLVRSGSLVARPQAEAARAFEHASLVALATPAEVSIELAGKLIAGGARVIDLSGAFRLNDAETFRRYYGFEHAAWELCAEARYALPQVGAVSGSRAPRITDTKLVSNPGCYATAAILALAPLCEAKLIEPGGIFIDGKSGVSGAGRKVAEKFMFMEVAENVSAYRVADHQHTPEIEQALSRVAGEAVTVTFAPHLMPIKRGLITTAYARATRETSAAELAATAARFYADSPRFEGARVVDVGSVDDASVASIWGTPLARVGFAYDARTRGVVAAGALDNLLKGAASQALENMLAMIGVTEATS
ncbi:MAG: N-acetyl-gamma-glutamyl-phosphate reductase [Myxococcales bacterium]|nr:N-acetyl-gamma-glutamyl-phosphate reductase [Myxococcales bacterium]